MNKQSFFLKLIVIGSLFLSINLARASLIDVMPIEQQIQEKPAVRRILITGTHGCGKSTLSYRICSELKKKGYNAVVISETARESCFPINKGQTENSTLYIALRQSVKELEAIARGYNYLVLDRGVCDSFIYSEASRPDQLLPSMLEKRLRGAFFEWMKGYDDIIFIKSDGNKFLQADGVRDTDMAYAKKVEALFENFLINNFSENLHTFSYRDLLNCHVEISANGKVNLRKRKVAFNYE